MQHPDHHLAETLRRTRVLRALQLRAADAPDTTSLAFLIANDTWHLVPYAQACLLLRDALGRLRLQAVSGLTENPPDTPFALWVVALAESLLGEHGTLTSLRLEAADIDEVRRSGWGEWWPRYALLLPLRSIPGGAGPQGASLLLRDTPWEDAEVELLETVHTAYGLALAGLRRPRMTLRKRFSSVRARHPRRLAIAATVLLGALLFPVRASVLAPAEIIALESEVVSAPADGVLERVVVQPNQHVRSGELLFTLDDTTIRNSRDIADRALQIARADVLAAQQKAFDNDQSRSELAALQGRVREKEAELAYLEEALERTEVRAAHDGVLIFTDPNDWIGKPVITGERLALLAQPEPLGVTVWLPVADAIMLDPGARVRVYLQVSPLDALSGTLVQTSFQATLSPEGIASYRIRARLDEGAKAHIGLRGIAKINGGWQPAVYWLLRRPIGALRQWAGM